MLSVLHPLLLWGVALVAVPVLIHLLLRQRPRPRPWAAMRWLLAAAQAAQRRWRLTNLLLLLLRCLAVLLIALAVARPMLAGLGSGGRVLLVVDATASMGERHDDLGAWAEALAGLGRDGLAVAQATVVAAGAQVRVLAERRPGAEALAQLAGAAPEPVPGGLDDALDRAGGERLAGLAAGCDVVLISDFQQDDGGRLAAALAGEARSVRRWAVGRAAPNPAIAGWTAPDLAPGSSGELVVAAPGAAGATLAIDGGPALAAEAIASGDRLRVVLPPLAEGRHVLRLALTGGGLRYDDVLELPVQVRGRVGALLVRDAPDYATSALAADDRGIAATAIAASALPAAVLPEDGAAVIRGRVADAARVRDWVRAGGVLWAEAALLRGDPALAELVAGLEPGAGERAGGPWRSGDAEIDEVLGLAGRDRVPDWRLPPECDVILRAGEAPAAVALPAGRGRVVAELLPLAGDAGLQARGTTPLWVVRTVRRLTAAAGAPLALVAGAPAPADGRFAGAAGEVDLIAGAPVLLAPGAWTGGGRDAVVLPGPGEGRLDRAPPADAVRTWAAALPQDAGADLGWWLLLAALAVVLAEGALAAWAGRTYGR